jgi:hypothetical protein
MSLYQLAIRQEKWDLFKSLLEDSPPDEDAIKSIVKSGLAVPVFILARSQYRMAKYGNQSQNMIHIIASYGNIDQINELASSDHWEELKAAQDKEGRTALEVVSQLLDKDESLVDHEYHCEVFGDFSDDIGAYTPWSEYTDSDPDFATYIEHLNMVADKLRERQSTTERG